MEYTFHRSARGREDVRKEIAAIESLLAAGLMLRYHLAFSTMELGHPDPESAREALAFHAHCLDIIMERGGRCVTLHVGLDAAVLDRLDYAAAAANLAELVCLGREQGISVCLENLRRGRTGDPSGYRSILETTGAGATLDIGHALAREESTGIPGYAFAFIEDSKERIRGAHVYEIEKVHEHTGVAWHKAPQDLERIKPMLDRLLERTGCGWWLVELSDPHEVANTLRLLREYLDGKCRSERLWDVSP